MDSAEQFIVCRVSFPQPQQRRVFGLGVAQYAEHPYAVHRLPQPLLIWFLPEAKHFRGMELALNGVNCWANNCFDVNGAPHLGEQMAGQPPMGRNRMVSVFPRA